MGMQIEDLGGGRGKLQATRVFGRLLNNFKRALFNVFVMEGGSRSSKTISIIQFWMLYAQHNAASPKRVVICRKRASWIKGTVLNDFIKVLKAYGWYNERSHNKTHNIYTLFGTEFWFIGLDDQQKLHGLTCDAFWINEAIEASNDDFDQLEQRCSGFAILDYNPSEEEHWIYDKVIKRDNCSFMHSTMLDNAFLPLNMRLKILSYEPTEANYRQGTVDKRKWDIYGLGKRAKIEGLVFPEIEIVPRIPEWVKHIPQGLDFGYTNDVTAHSNTAYSIPHNTIWIQELCYQTHMLTKDIIAHIKANNNRQKVISESADPRLIAEIEMAGINIWGIEKGAGSVVAGIDKMKGMKICVTEDSYNTIKEFKNYTYQQNKAGKFLNVPIDDFNHIIDGSRYVTLSEILGQGQPGTKWRGALH